jgi:hypothetical protein
MAIKPKQILDTAVDLGKAAVSAAERRLRGEDSETDRPPSTPGTPAAKTVPEAGGRAKARPKPSGSPSTVGAAKPGKPRGHKSATASAGARTPAGKAAAKPKATATAAKRGAAGSGGNGKAKTAPKAKTAATPKAAVEKGKAKPKAPKSTTPRKRPASARTAASEAAASSGKEVRDAASGKSD